MKYAWIENEKVRDVCEGGNPADCYTANVAIYYDTLVPDEAKNGDGWVDGQLVPYVPPPPPPPPPETWDDPRVRTGLTLTDKTRWDNNDTQQIVTAKIEFATPQQRPYTTELLTYLVASNSISQVSMDQVLTLPYEATQPYLDVSGDEPNVIE
jgi:hypothetical protein